MKFNKYTMALVMGLGVLTSCEDKLDLVNPNAPTTGSFGYNAEDLEECVIAAYNHMRMEGSYARVGFGYDIARGDETWNSSQTWNWLPCDNLNVPITNEETMWPWREWYYTLNVCNFIISRCEGTLSEKMQYIKGQALFVRALSYYNLVGYYQNPPLITNYNDYSTLNGLYATNSTYDDVLDQVEADFKEALDLLPSRDLGGEWAKGRATSGAAAGYLARTLMLRHKYSEALTYLKNIINKQYGEYKLMANYGDNFQEGPAYENNAESLFEVQFLDKESQGVDDEWTPVNTSPNATQGHAIESFLAPGSVGGWADISASPWLYNLFKAERTVSGSLDPRLYWTIGTYENDWEGFENGNVCYSVPMTAATVVLTNNNNGGLPVAKFTNFRTNLCDKVVTGLHCGINLRMLRYSDVLLRAAECENEVNGPTQQAIDWINEVRRRANLKDLQLSAFAGNAHKLFEQIANVERPKEFGCEFGRCMDLIRWGFFYDEGRLAQLKEHGSHRLTLDMEESKAPVSHSDVNGESVKCSFDSYLPGHEYLPISQGTLNANPNLKGNSANSGEANNANKEYFLGQGWTIHPVTAL